MSRVPIVPPARHFDARLSFAVDRIIVLIDDQPHNATLRRIKASLEAGIPPRARRHTR